MSSHHAQSQEQHDAGRRLSDSGKRGADTPASGRPFLRQLACSPSLYVIAIVLIVGALSARWVTSIGGPPTIRQWLGSAAPLVTVPIHVVVAITPFPSDAISIANGAVYGFASGAVLSWVGWWMAALCEFGLGRRVRHDFQLDSHLARTPNWLRRFPVDHPVFLIGARQVPWLGGHITSFVPGAAGVSLSRFAWCSIIAIIPGAVVMAGIGAGLLALQG